MLIIFVDLENIGLETKFMILAWTVQISQASTHCSKSVLKKSKGHQKQTVNDRALQLCSRPMSS